MDFDHKLVSETMKNMVSSDGKSLADHSFDSAVLLVFLRHFGCIYCKEAMKDLSQKKEDFLQKGIEISFVHMAEPELAASYFSDYGLEGVSHYSDPDCEYYKAFGLLKGSFSQLFGFNTWARGIEVSLLKGHGISWKQIGDGFQMPGIFLVNNGVIRDSFVHNFASDKPDYEDLISCCAA